MAARDVRLAIALLDLLSSSSSSSDEEELLEYPRKIPKIENFVQVVHNLTDKDVFSLFLQIILYYTWNNNIYCINIVSILQIILILKVIYNNNGLWAKLGFNANKGPYSVTRNNSIDIVTLLLRKYFVVKCDWLTMWLTLQKYTLAFMENIFMIICKPCECFPITVVVEWKYNLPVVEWKCYSRKCNDSNRILLFIRIWERFYNVNRFVT